MNIKVKAMNLSNVSDLGPGFGDDRRQERELADPQLVPSSRAQGVRPPLQGLSPRTAGWIPT